MFSKFFVNIEGLEIFAIATMILFLISFVVMVIWVFRIDKTFIEEQRNLPLKD
jgi:cbb3-type cytochrome oxidase subunit 3